MKKIIAWLFVLSLCAFWMTGCNSETEYTITMNDPSMLYEALPPSAKSGDTVNMKITKATDLGYLVFVNGTVLGEEAYSEKNEYWLFSFEMPNEDVVIDFKTYDGFFPDENYGKLIKTFWIQHPDAEYVQIREYYGAYSSGAVVAMIDSWEYTSTEWSENIAGYTFLYSDGNSIQVLHDGVFYKLSGAFEKGVLSEEDVESVYNRYRENHKGAYENMLLDLPQGDSPSYSQISETVIFQSITDFAVRLFKNSTVEGENTLLSPLSVLIALSMTVNGADGNTRAQMEAVLGMPTEELNTWILSYIENLPSDEKYKLSLANSIWFTDDRRFEVDDGFLKINSEYYNADVRVRTFDDATLKEINSWVSDKTDGMIENILDEIPKTAVMYLINALTFDAEWQDTYTKYQVRDGKFTREDGVSENVEMMHSEEGVYLEDENSKGVIKYYKGGRYAFAAILPNEGITVSEYVGLLDGKKVYSLLSNAKKSTVYTSIPKFESENDTEMSKILSKMGMRDAFSEVTADFSKLGRSSSGNIFINRVIHKTFISVGEKGTKAGAATVVEMTDECEPLVIDPKEVVLDRPFVYMLVDCKTNIPFFIGTAMSVE